MSNLNTLPTDYVESLKAAHDLQNAVEQLQDALDRILTPLAKAAVNLSQEELADFIIAMPPGFHRTELRTLYLSRQESK